MGNAPDTANGFIVTHGIAREYRVVPRPCKRSTVWTRSTAANSWRLSEWAKTDKKTTFLHARVGAKKPN